MRRGVLNGQNTKGDFVTLLEGGFTANRARVKDSETMT
jgi:hypothetical protein